jgi:hypothetical protein
MICSGKSSAAFVSASRVPGPEIDGAQSTPYMGALAMLQRSDRSQLTLDLNAFVPRPPILVEHAEYSSGWIELSGPKSAHGEEPSQLMERSTSRCGFDVEHARSSAVGEQQG